MRSSALMCVLLLSSCGPKTVEAPTKKAAEEKKPKITHFYANAGVVPKGETVTLCYGTENVESVKLTPYEDEIAPSMNRCIGAKPERETTYTLTAKGASGEVSETVTVRVGAPEPKSAPTAGGGRELIQSFQYIGKPTIERGSSVQLCYTTSGATSVSVSPPVKASLQPGKNQCFLASPQKTTNYVLTARAADGTVDRMQVTIPVQ